jgi:mannose-6-phosphate isomerase-like protein (cupin superfamily)
MKKINLQEKFSLFDEHWSPKTIATLNGQAVKLAKVKGEFVWHDHANEDELFLVVKGELTIVLEKKEEVLKEGELYVVPRGTKHKPIAQEECWILLFEPREIKHTGDEISELSKENEEWI